MVELKKSAKLEEVEDLRDSNAQKDRKIRNLNTTVTLLKNFLLFVNKKAIKGLKLSNIDMKKEIEELRKKHKQEFEENKKQIIKEIENFAS